MSFIKQHFNMIRKLLFSLQILLLSTNAYGEQHSVCFYPEANYHGVPHCYFYDQTPAVFAFPESVGSIQLTGNAYIELFELEHFEGKKSVVMANTFDVDHVLFHSFKIALRRKSESFACLFPGTTFQGMPMCTATQPSLNTYEHIELADTFMEQLPPKSLLISGHANVTLYSDQHLIQLFDRSVAHIPEKSIADLTTFAVQRRDKSAIEQVIYIQQMLNLTTPIIETQWIGSHNLYNSTAYRKKSPVLGFNHTLSLTEQMDLGARHIEMDFHNYQGKNFVCHAVDCYFGAKTPFRRLLGELDNWFKGHEESKEFIMVYLDDYHYTPNAEYYTPLQEDIAWFDRGHTYIPSTNCSLDPDTTIQQLLNQKQRFLFYTNSKESSAICDAGQRIITDFEDGENAFKYHYDQKDNRQHQFFRVYAAENDVVHNFFPFNFVKKISDRYFNPNIDPRKAMLNGTNIIGSDFLDSDSLTISGKIGQQLWTINPKDISHIGKYKPLTITPEGHYYFSTNDLFSTMHYACKQPDGAWFISHQTGPFNPVVADQMCSTEVYGARFSMPLNIIDADALRKVLLSTPHRSAYIRATIHKNGDIKL